MKTGVQMFGCSKLYNSDPHKFLKGIKDAGFDQVEPCIAFGDMGELGDLVWKSTDLDRHFANAAEFGLNVSSCHVFAGSLEDSGEEMARCAEKYGIKQYVLGYRGEAEKAEVKKFTDDCRKLSGVLGKTSIWLHNGGNEISSKMDDISVYEWIVKQSDGILHMQVDVGWVAYAGESVMEFLERNDQYIASIHYKDFSDFTPEGTNAALGDGIVDIESACRYAVSHSKGNIVDQDSSTGDMLEDLRKSVEYLNSISSEVK
jgi:sugar phosphate isomerase/epimerase